MPQGSYIHGHLDEMRMLPWVQDKLSCLCAKDPPNLALRRCLSHLSVTQNSRFEDLTILKTCMLPALKASRIIVHL